jgi:E3 SUMO-protein ligase PIAS1
MAPLPGAAPVTNRQIPIEYPNAPDVTVDDSPISCKERGLRGKAGSAPPFDLDKSSRRLTRMPGRLATIVMGHSGPTVSKKKEVAKVRVRNMLAANAAAVLVSSGLLRDDPHG